MLSRVSKKKEVSKERGSGRNFPKRERGEGPKTNRGKQIKEGRSKEKKSKSTREKVGGGQGSWTKKERKHERHREGDISTEKPKGGEGTGIRRAR